MPSPQTGVSDVLGRQSQLILICNGCDPHANMHVLTQLPQQLIDGGEKYFCFNHDFQIDGFMLGCGISNSIANMNG